MPCYSIDQRPSINDSLSVSRGQFLFRWLCIHHAPFDVLAPPVMLVDFAAVFLGGDADMSHPN